MLPCRFQPIGAPWFPETGSGQVVDVARGGVEVLVARQRAGDVRRGTHPGEPLRSASTRGSGVALDALRSGVTLDALDTLDALRTGSTCVALVALDTLDALGTLRAHVTLVTLDALDALGTLVTLDALRASGTLRTPDLTGVGPRGSRPREQVASGGLGTTRDQVRLASVGGGVAQHGQVGVGRHLPLELEGVARRALDDAEVGGRLVGVGDDEFASTVDRGRLHAPTCGTGCSLRTLGTTDVPLLNPTSHVLTPLFPETLRSVCSSCRSGCRRTGHPDGLRSVSQAAGRLRCTRRWRRHRLAPAGREDPGVPSARPPSRHRPSRQREPPGSGRRRRTAGRGGWGCRR